MARAKISDVIGQAAVLRALQESPSRQDTALAVRFLLQDLAERFPGGTLEVRVPPFGAVQCLEGPKHTRGTPPNVVEMAPEIWLRIATGDLSWEEARAAGLASASGTRASLTGLTPLRSARL